MRFAFRTLWLIGLVLFCVPLHLLWRLFHIQSPWPQRFLGWCARAVGMRATIVGTPAKGVVLYAANHQSWKDILLIGGITGASFVSKESVRNWPAAGHLATMVGTIYISNSDRRDAAKQAQHIRDALADGKSVAFFPEGRLNEGQMIRFRPALFGAVVPPEGDVVVQPIAIDYGENSEALIWRRGSHAARHAKAVMNRPGLQNVTIHMLEPIVPHADSHRRDIAALCEAAIADALGQEVEDTPA